MKPGACYSTSSLSFDVSIDMNPFAQYTSEKRSTTYLSPRIVSIYLELCVWPGILYKTWNNWNLLARCNIRTSSHRILERVVGNVLAFQTHNGIEKMYTMDRIFCKQSLQTIELFMVHTILLEGFPTIECQTMR